MVVGCTIGPMVTYLEKTMTQVGMVATKQKYVMGSLIMSSEPKIIHSRLKDRFLWARRVLYDQ